MSEDSEKENISLGHDLRLKEPPRSQNFVAILKYEYWDVVYPQTKRYKVRIDSK